MDDLVERVEVERRLRGWSAREAAVLGGTSNTTWSNWERSGGPPSNSVRGAVAEAFGWPTTWPESPPALPPPEAASMITQLGLKLDRVLDEVATQQQVERLVTVMDRIAEQLEAQGASIERVSGLLDREMRPQRRAGS